MASRPLKSSMSKPSYHGSGGFVSAEVCSRAGRSARPITASTIGSTTPGMASSGKTSDQTRCGWRSMRRPCCGRCRRPASVTRRGHAAMSAKVLQRSMRSAKTCGHLRRTPNTATMSSRLSKHRNPRPQPRPRTIRRFRNHRPEADPTKSSTRPSRLHGWERADEVLADLPALEDERNSQPDRQVSGGRQILKLLLQAIDGGLLHSNTIEIKRLTARLLFPYGTRRTGRFAMRSISPRQRSGTGSPPTCCR